ncbi:hypothetical protein SteCoe_17622 [Stentor coeruleus]|uniref:C2H2-type domain-containing protein n=1 Tax=Stentor coeruleus TaxID=5963 RepID=A0A1R2BYI4_9CILI|nr:hypothetical protein SteCoe_17622 [Stentor coeruleus]
MSTRKLPLKCNFTNCDKEYSTKYNLKRHLETVHSNLKRFRCRLCGKNLSSKQNLNEHIFTHSNEKPFGCSEPGCSQNFRQRSQLSNHRKIHRELFSLAQQMKKISEVKVKTNYLTALLQQHSEEISLEATYPKSIDFIILPSITEWKTKVILPPPDFK